MKNARNAPQINLKLPPEMKRHLHHAAIDNHRSLNSEVLIRLEKSVEAEKGNGIEVRSAKQ